MIESLVHALGLVAYVLQLLIVVRAVLSFIPNIQRHPAVQTLDMMVDPILRPFQRLLPPMGGLDLSPIIAILAINVLVSLLQQLLVMVGMQMLHLS